MVALPPLGQNEPAEAWIRRVLPILHQALNAGPGVYAVDGGGNVYVTAPIPPGSVRKLGVAPKIVTIDTENLVEGAVTLAATDIPQMVLANKLVAGDAVILTLLAGEIEAVEATIDNLVVNDAQIANLSASKITAGDIAVELNLYAANILGGNIAIDGGTGRLLFARTNASTFAGAFEQQGSGGGVSVICNNGSFAANGVDVQVSGSGRGVAANANGGYAMLGVSSSNDAVRGECGDGTHAGVRGVGGLYGVYGSAANTTAAGILGEHTGTAGDAGLPLSAGVRGTSTNGWGVIGSGGAAGVRGYSSGGYGVHASSGGAGARIESSRGNDGGDVMTAEATNGGYFGSVIQSKGSSSNTYNLFAGIHSNDTKFLVTSTGEVRSDFATTMSLGADYAEYFETASGLSVTPGETVVLEGEKIRPATEEDDSEDVFGVVRPKLASCVVGNAAWSGWHGRYAMTEFGAPVLDVGGHPVLSPDFDPTQIYIPREERPEWCIVGLVGQVAISAGQVVNPRWRLMRAVSDNVNLWMIR